jgi:hypothetical protein
VFDTASGRELVWWHGERTFRVTGLTSNGSGLIADSSGTDSVLRPAVVDIKCWAVADRRERWSIDHVVGHVPVEGGRRLAMQRQDDSAGLNEVILVDADDGRALFRRPLRHGEELWNACPDGRTLLTMSDDRSARTLVRNWLAGHGLPALAPEPASTVELINVASGARLLSLGYPDSASHGLSPGGETLAVLDDGRLTVWDVPPPKSLT